MKHFVFKSLYSFVLLSSLSSLFSMELAEYKGSLYFSQFPSTNIKLPQISCEASKRSSNSICLDEKMPLVQVKVSSGINKNVSGVEFYRLLQCYNMPLDSALRLKHNNTIQLNLDNKKITLHINCFFHGPLFEHGLRRSIMLSLPKVYPQAFEKLVDNGAVVKSFGINQYKWNGNCLISMEQIIHMLYNLTPKTQRCWQNSMLLLFLIHQLEQE